LDYVSTFRQTQDVANSVSTIVFYLDDMHWADESSIETLTELMYKLQDLTGSQNVSGLRLYVSCRDEGLEKLNGIKAKNRLTELKLHPFDEKNVKSYISAVFGEAKIEDSLQKAIPEIDKKVGGNPVFLQELIKSLVELDLIVRQKRAWALTDSIEKTEIPTNLKDLIVARIERLNLTVEQGHILLTLALLQYPPTFEVFNQIISVDQAFLTKLVNLEILKTETIEEQIVYRTAHDLIREVLLSQTHIVLTTLHQHIAERLEAIQADNLEAYVQPLAYHYSEADNREKALLYLEKAGDQAQENYQNEKAIEFYNRLLVVINELLAANEGKNDAHGKQLTINRIDILLKKGKILKFIGRLTECQSVHAETLHLAEDILDEQRMAKANYNLGGIFRQRGDYDTAIDCFQRAQVLFEVGADRKGIGSISI